MSFSAQTCITNTGTTQLGPTLYFYSDINGYQGVFGSDSTENLIGDNCPYTMENIPDGTTAIRIIDPTTNCCLDVNLQSNNLCNTCNLDFDVYETQTVSEIVAGNLIGSCDDNISDYIINWYGPGEGSTNLAFTSGYGTEFSNIGWDLTHPLTGSSSPIVEAGIYTPVIDRVVVNGTSFSLTGAPDTYIANLDCFTSALVTVDAIKCDNGNLPPGGIYSHFFQFNNASVGNPPIGLSASFSVSSNTNYIAWQFRGYDIYDTLKMTFYGSAYNYIPLVIENTRIGSNSGNLNIVYTTNPKTIPYSDFVKKVTCLTAFTINEGDYITINITPNNINNNTLWDFYLKCLDSFDCSTCFDQFEDSLGKIYSAGTYSDLSSCNKTTVVVPFSSCTQNDFNQTDIGKYLQKTFQASLNSAVWVPPGVTTQLYFNNITCSSVIIGSDYICDTPTSNSYSFEKTLTDSGEGLLSFNFESFSDLTHYYNSYQSAISTIDAYYGGSSNDNTIINYYRNLNLFVPYNVNPDEQCGDTTPTLEFSIHHTSVVTTGGTGPYTMTLTMPSIVNNMNFTNCDLYCNYFINEIVNYANLSSLSTDNNIQFTTNTCSRYDNPFTYLMVVNSGNTPSTQSVINNYLMSYWTFENETYVYSGNNILVSSLTGQTCTPKGNPQNLGTPGAGSRFTVYSHQYKVELTDSNNLTSFQVLAPDVSNYLTSPTFTNTAMTVVNNVVTYANPNYCI